MKLPHFSAPLGCFCVTTGALLAAITLSTVPAAAQTLTGQAAFTDYTKEHPGVRRKLTVADLPEPYATPSANNGPAIFPRPGRGVAPGAGWFQGGAICHRPG